LKKHKLVFERLEFLGDRVLNLVIAEHLFRYYETADEGALSKYHANLVCSVACCSVAKQIGLSEFINVSNPALRTNESVLADAVEALISAVFLDSDANTVTNFVKNLWKDLLRCGSVLINNSKSELQEISQGKGYGTPVYRLVSQTGDDHSPEFEVMANVLDYSAKGRGKSKKEAENIAAEKLICQITKTTCSKTGNA
jgi:ribonuclease-3